MGLASVRGSGLTAWPPRRGLRLALGERGGLAEAGAMRRVQFMFETPDLLAQALALPSQAIARPLGTRAVTLEAFEFRPLPFNLTALPFDLGLLSFHLVQQVLARSGSPAGLHALVMPYRREKYKYEKLDISRGERAAVTSTR
jgi:hypothetical protein